MRPHCWYILVGWSVSVIALVASEVRSHSWVDDFGVARYWAAKPNGHRGCRHISSALSLRSARGTITIFGYYNDRPWRPACGCVGVEDDPPPGNELVRPTYELTWSHRALLHGEFVASGPLINRLGFAWARLSGTAGPSEYRSIAVLSLPDWFLPAAFTLPPLGWWVHVRRGQRRRKLPGFAPVGKC